jgi:hypothetical protein
MFQHAWPGFSAFLVTSDMWKHVITVWGCTTVSLKFPALFFLYDLAHDVLRPALTGGTVGYTLFMQQSEINLESASNLANAGGGLTRICTYMLVVHSVADSCLMAAGQGELKRNCEDVDISFSI